MRPAKAATSLIARRARGKSSRRVAWGLMVLTACFLIRPSEAQELKHFLSRRGDQLMDGDETYRFLSFNIPNLLLIEDAYGFTGTSPWRWPDEFEIEDALESVRQMGGQAVRAYTISVYREGSDAGKTVHVLGPGEFNEDGFRTLDKVLEVANRKGVRVIIPLVDNWRWMGGVPQYAAFRGKPAESFWSDPQLIEDFKKTIEYVITRKNTYTGVRYRDDKAVFGWETGNELDATPAWTREIAAYIKQLDKNHLVIDGRSTHGITSQSLDDPNIDLLSTHHYPGRTNDFVPLIRQAYSQTKGKKPYFVGEFGFVEARMLKPVIEAVVEEGISGALIWSLRYHRREGGFYWHMEVGSGRNIYKAYHWPGFDSGAAYEERPMMELMRRKAFEIRGLEPPPIQRPAPPTLLPIQHPARISWQGSAGAASYEVQRASGPDGPWTSVGRDISDAAVQYRPLFSDQDAAPGEAYYYRVVARNEGGDSEPSKVVGPVEIEHRLLVDECADMSLVHETDGQMKVASENARQFQEDCHRLALTPGSSVTYRLDGPVSAWRVYAFATQPDAELHVAGSPDGTRYEPLQIDSKAYGLGAGDYGYMIPVLYHGQVSDQQGSCRYLRITRPPSSPDATTDTAKPSQAERLEISRVEIEWGGDSND